MYIYKSLIKTLKYNLRKCFSLSQLSNSSLAIIKKQSHRYCETKGCREMTSWFTSEGLFFSLSHRKCLGRKV